MGEFKKLHQTSKKNGTHIKKNANLSDRKRPRRKFSAVIRSKRPQL